MVKRKVNTAKIISFPLPSSGKIFLLLRKNGFIRDGILWIGERFLLSALHLDALPRHHIKAGDRKQFEYKGQVSYFVKEEVFWRVQWNGFSESPHENELIDLVYLNGRKEDAWPRNKVASARKLASS